MLAKLLGNRFAMIGIIAGLAIVVLVIIQLNERNNSNYESNNEYEAGMSGTVYQQLVEDILKYEKTKTWNTGKYQLIKKNLSDNVDIKKINKKQEEQLLKLLISKHLMFLKDSIIGFCENAEFGTKISYLEKDLSNFKNEPIAKMTKLVTQWKGFSSLIWGLDSYTTNKQHKDSKNKYYNDKLLEYEVMQHFMENNSVQNKKVQKIKVLAKHVQAYKGLKRRYDSPDNVGKNDIIKFQETFKEFKYYKIKFDSIYNAINLKNITN